jgi:hypothetical protein
LTRGLRDGEPAYYETRSYFDDDGNLVRRVMPEGNEMRYRYATEAPRARQSNMVELRMVAGPRGGGEDIVVTYGYEPLYNQVASVTDPRGNALQFAPPLGQASAARYTTRRWFDYQESAAPVPEAEQFGIDLGGVERGLGDLNGDGRLDQTAGNLVRVEAPDVLLEPGNQSAATVQRSRSEARWNDRGQPAASIDPEGNITEFQYHPEVDPDGDGTTTFSPFLALGRSATGLLRRTIVDSALPSGRRATGSA